MDDDTGHKIAGCILGLLVVGVTVWNILDDGSDDTVKPINYQVTSASLTQFDLSTANETLDYNLALNLTVHNPNKHVGVCQDGIKATASFKYQELDNVTFSYFYLGKRETVTLPVSFKGQRHVSLPVDEVSPFKNNATDFDILLSLDVTQHDKGPPPVVCKQCIPKVECNLKVPLKSNGNSGEGFNVTECKYPKL